MPALFVPELQKRIKVATLLLRGVGWVGFGLLGEPDFLELELVVSKTRIFPCSL